MKERKEKKKKPIGKGKKKLEKLAPQLENS